MNDLKEFKIESRYSTDIKLSGLAKDFKEFITNNKFNLSESDLSESDLSGSDLSWSNLSESDFSESDLSGSDLSWSNLSRSNLSGSNLSRSDLSRSDLSESDLSRSNLSGSNLSGSNLSGSNLSGSNLSRSNLSGSDLSWSDLSESKINPFSYRNIFIKLPKNSKIESVKYSEIIIIIGCKAGTIKEWDKWFKSDEEFETKRDTFRFKQIYAHYRSVREYCKVLWKD